MACHCRCFRFCLHLELGTPLGDLLAKSWWGGVWLVPNWKSLLKENRAQRKNLLKRFGEEAAEAPSAVSNVTSAFASPAPSTKGRHFLVICCENKAILLDLVTIMEFLSKLGGGVGPLVAFGGSDGVIRVLSMITWKLVWWYTGGHKGSISCLMTFMASSGEALLVSGASDGLLILWSADHSQDSKELVSKLSLKAHGSGVIAVELSRVIGGAPHHNRAIEHPTYSALTRPLCELSSLIPPQMLAPNKKLRVYCMVAHTLQPYIVATGTNIGVFLCEFDPRSIPAVAPLPTPSKSREHSAVYIVDRELKLLSFQLSTTGNPSLGNNASLAETGRSKGESPELLHVKQTKKHISTPVPHDSYSVLSMSSSGK